MGPHLEGVDKTCSRLFYCALPQAPPLCSHLVNKELGSNVCSNVNEMDQRSNSLVLLRSQLTQLERQGSSIHFRWMGGNYRTHYTVMLVSKNATKYSVLHYTYASMGFCRFQTSLTGVCEEAVKAARVDMYGCVPPGSSSAGLIIRTDRWRWLMLIAVFDFYCIKVSTDTCSSRLWQRSCIKNWVGGDNNRNILKGFLLWKSANWYFIIFLWLEKELYREKNSFLLNHTFLLMILMPFEFISENNPGVICSCAASTVFLIWHQICHCRLILQPCPEYRWWIGPLGVMTRNTTGEQNMKNRLGAAVGWIRRTKPRVSLLHCGDGGFLLAHVNGTSPPFIKAQPVTVLRLLPPCVWQPLHNLPTCHQLTGHLERQMSTDAIR